MFDLTDNQLLFLISAFILCICLIYMTGILITLRKHRKAKMQEIRDRYMRRIDIECHPDRRVYSNATTGKPVYETFRFKCVDGKTGRKTVHEYIVKEY